LEQSAARHATQQRVPGQASINARATIVATPIKAMAHEISKNHMGRAITTTVRRHSLQKIDKEVACHSRLHGATLPPLVRTSDTSAACSGNASGLFKLKKRSAFRNHKLAK